MKSIEEAPFKTLLVRISLLLFVTMCSGCALHIKTNPIPIQRQIVLNYVTHEVHCERALAQAQAYLQGEGILLVRGTPTSSDYTLICIPPRPLWLSLFPAVHGQAYPEVGYFQASRSETQSAKILLHELGHVMGATHSASGIMTPLAEGLHFASGYSRGTLRKIRVAPLLDLNSTAFFRSAAPLRR